MKILVIKTLANTFAPCYDSDLDKVKKIKAGQEMLIEITKPRNVKFHRKYFALLNMLLDNQEIYTNIEDLRHDLTIEAGYFEEYTTFIGEIKKKPKSISFSKMDDYEFSAFYDSTINVIVKHFNFDKQDIIDNVSQYF